MFDMFLDDERMPPKDRQSWKIARNKTQAIILVRNYGFPHFVSFDHDLGEDEPTGYDIAKWLVELDMSGEDVTMPDDFDYYVHSQNPIGKQNIECYLDNYLKFKGLR